MLELNLSSGCIAKGSHFTLFILALGRSAAKRQSAYRTLFEHQVSDNAVEKIRVATNKEWVLGNEKFLQQIEALSQRQTQPKPHGGRRSKKAREGKKLLGSDLDR